MTEWPKDRPAFRIVRPKHISVRKWRRNRHKVRAMRRLMLQHQADIIDNIELMARPL